MESDNKPTKLLVVTGESFIQEPDESTFYLKFQYEIEFKEIRTIKQYREFQKIVKGTIQEEMGDSRNIGTIYIYNILTLEYPKHY